MRSWPKMLYLRGAPCVSDREYAVSHDYLLHALQMHLQIIRALLPQAALLCHAIYNHPCPRNHIHLRLVMYLLGKALHWR